MTPRDAEVLHTISTLTRQQAAALYIATGTPFAPGERLADARAFIEREYRVGRLRVEQILDVIDQEERA